MYGRFPPAGWAIICRDTDLPEQCAAVPPLCSHLPQNPAMQPSGTPGHLAKQVHHCQLMCQAASNHCVRSISRDQESPQGSPEGQMLQQMRLCLRLHFTIMLNLNLATNAASTDWSHLSDVPQQVQHCPQLRIRDQGVQLQAVHAALAAHRGVFQAPYISHPWRPAAQHEQFKDLDRGWRRQQARSCWQREQRSHWKAQG